MNPDAQENVPPDERMRIDVTFVLPRRLMWLLAGVVIGNLGSADDLLVKSARRGSNPQAARHRVPGDHFG